MNISYNWLKDYLDFDLQPDEVAAALTSIGLETGGVEEVQTIKGGLEGLVIGEVLTCEEHPNSDHLHITTVNVGGAEPLQIVCGAPNVAAGQKVVVAVNGTKLYDGDECFTIKRSKIRGVESNGMICAEDEIGIGTDHAGIIVLPADAVVGTPAKEYYNVKSDYVLEVDITPNRVDATSHFGVARDLAAYLKQNGKPANLKRPNVDAFKIDDETPAIEVVVENTEACLRYSGITIKGVTVKESPEWLQNRLKVIGLRPINNVVDVTNYILHGVGQPLHSFDADKVKGNKVVVRSAKEGSKFVTLDGVERTLTDRDLDPPLHEFLPTKHEDIKELAADMGMTFDDLKNVVASLHEFNPMMGHRGCRLAVTYPEIAAMQTRAVIKAALNVSAETGCMITPHIMIPLVGEVKELKFVKDVVVKVADELIAAAGVEMKYQVGTMIEIPRAALTAGEIAKEAEFFSFGTNDLTQMTFGFSRDDAAKFLGAYYENKIYESDPFQHLDQVGVGKLVKMAAHDGRETRPDLGLGICGEHGGDPTSVEFCHNVGLDYVSCSPFRVPIARLAAAQAAIKNPRK